MPEQKGHPNAAILMEIAKEAAVNEVYWKEFQFLWGDRELKDCENGVIFSLHMGYKIRRKPRTIRIGNYDVPEFKARKHQGSLSQSSIVIELGDEEHAELMLKALQELLGAKK